jgi:thiamine kinase-like enzyme
MTLDPARLLELIPVTRGRAFRLTPLEGGLTNQNYRVDLPATPESGAAMYVLRIAGPGTEQLGIHRENEVACNRAATALGISPAVVAFLPEHGAMLRHFVSGRPLTPDELRQPATLARIVDTLRRYHATPPGEHRFCPFATIRSYLRQAQERAVPFPGTVSTALTELTRLEKALAPDEPPCPCHNDLLAANLIDSASGLQIIDWEYAGAGDRFFDLGNFAVNNELTAADEHTLLRLYFGGVHPQHLRRLQGMRLVSDLREALWGFLQAGLSAGAGDYLAYGRRHLDRFLRQVSSW